MREQPLGLSTTKQCPRRGKRMREQPHGPSVGLPMGPRSAALGEGSACESSHWRLRWSSL
eukprot:4321690-Pyramimonas_sp.AAC.1